MSPEAAQLRFAVEFATIAAAAFLHGSLLTGTKELAVIGLRGAGIVLLSVGTLGWGEDRASRRALWISLVLMAVAEGASVTDAGTVADWARGAGALALGTVLIT